MISTIKLKCSLCNNEFIKSKSEYNRRIKKGKKHFFCSLNCSASFGLIQIKIENEKDYKTNPKKCLCCNDIISYSKRINKFCSQRCSATYNQKDGGHCKWNEKDKKLISLRMIEYHKKNPKVKRKISQRLCKECGGNLIEKKKQICGICKEKYYKYYRPLCEFDFNPCDYPDKFDLNLIKMYGKYSPTNKGNNLKGISRDHLYCVKDGFKNKIDPSVIKHPANCRLITHTENQKKYNHSIITLDELKQKILLWK